MKAVLLFLLTILIFFVSEAQQNLVNLDFSGKSVYQLVARNVSNPMSLKFHYNSHYPPSAEQSSVFIESNGIFYVEQYMIKPEVILASINNRLFWFYALPNDTLTIILDCESTNLIEGISFEGKSAAMSYYYNQKNKNVRYNDLSKEELLTIDLQTYANTIDSLYSKQISFFDSYSNKDSLPDWFAKMEKNEILYLHAQSKLSVLLIKQLEDESLKVDPSYLNFLNKVALCNHEAFYSNAYFDFLDDYFNYNVPPSELRKKSGTMRALKIYDYNKSFVDEKLSGAIRDMYVTRELAALIDGTELGFLEIDSFIAENETKFIDTQLWEFLIGLRKEYMFKEDPLVYRDAVKRGQPAPNFRLEDINGKFHTMESFFGYVVYLHFWSLDSKPSIEALSQFEGFETNFRGKRFETVHICLSTDNEKWLKIIKEKNIGGINLIAPYNIADFKKLFRILTVPHFAIVSKDGRLHKNLVDGPDKALQDILELFAPDSAQNNSD